MPTAFRFIEYNGDDAGDVLVSLLMNLAHPELARSGGPEVEEVMSDVSKPVTVIGFVPNPPQDEDEEEVEDEDEQDDSER